MIEGIHVQKLAKEFYGFLLNKSKVQGYDSIETEYFRYKKLNYQKMDIKGISILLFEDGKSMINDSYDAKILGLEHTKIFKIKELKELIEKRIG